MCKHTTYSCCDIPWFRCNSYCFIRVNGENVTMSRLHYILLSLGYHNDLWICITNWDMRREEFQCKGLLHTILKLNEKSHCKSLLCNQTPFRIISFLKIHCNLTLSWFSIVVKLYILMVYNIYLYILPTTCPITLLFGKLVKCIYTFSWLCFLFCS